MMYGSDYGAYAAAAAATMIVIVVVALVIGIPLYILTSLGLMKLAQRRGIENPWLAWIPIANVYILGKLVGSFDIGTKNVNKLEFVLPIVLVVQVVLGAIPFLGSLISLAAWILYIFVAIKLFKMYAPTNYVLYTVLSAIGLFGIMFFIIRNNDPVEVPSIGQPLFK